jgi:L-ribulose-5-phosphate 3-epimerase
MNDRIGFMQGRFSPIVDGRIQSFPWNCWADEFASAERAGFHLMEWTLDQERLYENPLLRADGQAQIRELCKRHGLAIPSLTGDCFMQAPFWKAQGAERASLHQDFLAIAEACATVGIGTIVVPLVDNGSCNDAAERDVLAEFLDRQKPFLAARNLRVVFESDLAPAELAAFIAPFDATRFGINYDMGNSASMGFDSAAELAAYGERVLNVHIKDRVLGGTTVPLGTGSADFERIFAALARIGYAGNYILQTARAADGQHAQALERYRDMAAKWLRAHAA